MRYEKNEDLSLWVNLLCASGISGLTGVFLPYICIKKQGFCSAARLRLVKGLHIISGPMMSSSYSNLLELASGEVPSPSFSRMGRRIPRVMTVPGIMSDLDDDPSESVCSDRSSSLVQRDRIIIVANQLPIKVSRKPRNGKGWNFSLDDNSLLLQLKDGLGDDDMEVIYVGCLKEDIHPNEQDEVSQTLLENFKCVPTFIPPDMFSRYYHEFCKQQLWPLFHYMLPLSPDLGGRFNRSLWQASAPSA